MGPGRLRFPMGVAVDGSGTVAFVADTYNNRLVQLRLTDGVQLGTPLGGPSVGDTFSKPRGVTWAVMPLPGTAHPSHGQHTPVRVVIVVDTGNNRVACFKVTGAGSYADPGTDSMGYQLLWSVGSLGSSIEPIQVRCDKEASYAAVCVPAYPALHRTSAVCQICKTQFTRPTSPCVPTRCA